MGIEPTNRRLDRRLNDFEDRGGHQPAKHFRIQRFPSCRELWFPPGNPG